MDWLQRMNHAIDYIEDNLENNIDYEQIAEISFANKTSIVLVKSDELNEYTHIPFNLESHNMIKSRSRLIEKGVSVSKSSISDGFYCLDFFDPDGEDSSTLQNCLCISSFPICPSIDLPIAHLASAELPGKSVQ
ncbi:hypothetical protein [Paenibacillus sp. sptzw28]|uniref:hypothetical protein n=1 Tax=Paenibacillus sp. sptzw28 TaxID=715179 RepID=UPI0021617618|nr:hypothetical protein [Paenibacillus sp. sptzw28]